MKRNETIKVATAILISITWITVMVTGAFQINAAYNPTTFSATTYIAKPTTGKNLLIFGDSESETSIRPNNWPAQITSLGFTNIYNYSVGGARFKDFGGATTNQQVSDQIAAAISDGRSPDVIIFFLLTNDQEVSLGTTATAFAAGTLGALDRTKLCEAMRYAFWKAETQWPGVKRYCVLPMQRTDVNIISMTTMRQDAIDVAGHEGVTIIDATYESGITTTCGLFADGVHLTATGSAYPAKLISAKLLSTLMQ